MKRLLALALALLLCISLLPAAAETTGGSGAGVDTAALDAAFSKMFKTYKTSGGALMIAKGDEVVYTLYYGMMNKKAKKPVDENTVFKIASVTKFVTGIHVMQLVEQGLLDLDEDISTYLGYKVQNPYKPKHPLTLRMLMTHTSSLDPHSGYSNLKYGLRFLISADRKARGNYYNEVPGSKYRYSNFGAGIMGSLIESVTGKNLNTSVTEGVFEPMGIQAGYAASLIENAEDVSAIYKKNGALYQSADRNIRAGWDDSVDPDKHYRITVGSLWIRPRDLMRLAMLMCHQGTQDGVTLLQPETVAEMMSEQQGKGAVTAETPYGLCVHHETSLVKGKTFYGHQGMFQDVLCDVYYDPETDFTFLLVTNGGNNSMNDHVTSLCRKTFALAWETFGG